MNILVYYFERRLKKRGTSPNMLTIMTDTLYVDHKHCNLGIVERWHKAANILQTATKIYVCCTTQVKALKYNWKNSRGTQYSNV